MIALSSLLWQVVLPPEALAAASSHELLPETWSRHRARRGAGRRIEMKGPEDDHDCTDLRARARCSGSAVRGWRFGDCESRAARPRIDPVGGVVGLGAADPGAAKRAAGERVAGCNAARDRPSLGRGNEASRAALERVRRGA